MLNRYIRISSRFLIENAKNINQSMKEMIAELDNEEKKQLDIKIEKKITKIILL